MYYDWGEKVDASAAFFLSFVIYILFLNLLKLLFAIFEIFLNKIVFFNNYDKRMVTKNKVIKLVYVQIVI